MARLVRCGLIQASCEWSPEKHSLGEIKKQMTAKHERLIEAAGKRKVRVLGLQELFYGPYFCAEQQTRWYELTEPVPDGPTVARMQKLAKRYHMVMIVPVYEIQMAGVFFNTAAVIDADGHYLGSIGSTTYLIAIPASGRSFTSPRETAAIPFFRRAMAESAFISAMTAISPRARVFWG